MTHTIIIIIHDVSDLYASYTIYHVLE